MLEMLLGFNLEHMGNASLLKWQLQMTSSYYLIGQALSYCYSLSHLSHHSQLLMTNSYCLDQRFVGSFKHCKIMAVAE